MTPEPTQSIFPIPLIEELMSREEFIRSANVQWLQEMMAVTNDQIRLVADVTSGQCNNPSWLAIRKLRFTASKFGDILHAAHKQVLVI